MALEDHINALALNTSEESADEADVQDVPDAEEVAVELAEAQRQAQLDHIQKTYGLTTIDDPNVDELPADEELAGDIPSDATYIDLVHLKVRSLESLHLDRFTQLESINLRDNLIVSLNALKVLPESSKKAIRELDFYDNRIKHISRHVSEFPELRTLDLSFNNIKHIKHLEGLGQLRELFFVQNRITKIENVDHLVELENLEFGGNRIERIEGLNTFGALRQLWLGQNRISKLEGLEALSQLRVLSIQSNRIEKLEGLEALGQLEELYVSHNRISKLEGLDKLVNLQVLDVTGNRISRVEGLDSLTCLTDLWCSYNQIGDYDNVRQGLAHCQLLETVYFEGNPLQLQSPAMYRTKLRMALPPSVVKIDALYIQSNRMVA